MLQQRELERVTMSGKCDLQNSKDELNKKDNELNKKDREMQTLRRRLDKKDEEICEKDKVIHAHICTQTLITQTLILSSNTTFTRR